MSSMSSPCTAKIVRLLHLNIDAPHYSTDFMRTIFSKALETTAATESTESTASTTEASTPAETTTEATTTAGNRSISSSEHFEYRNL